MKQIEMSSGGVKMSKMKTPNIIKQMTISTVPCRSGALAKDADAGVGKAGFIGSRNNIGFSRSRDVFTP